MNAATTVGGSAAVNAITSSITLAKKTPIGVIEQVGKKKTLSLYRESTMAPGQYSKDVYILEKGSWEWNHKDSIKYPRPPFAPTGASHYTEDAFEFWTKGPITNAEKKRLKRWLTRL